MKNSMISKIRTITAASVIILLLSSTPGCRKKQSNEGELITTVKVTLKNGVTTIGSFAWRDPDGEGGNSPLPTDTITLDSGVTYKATIEFLNESSGSQNLTQEIKDEASDHRICFTVTPASIAIAITDSDGQYPIGLESDWTCSAKGQANLRVILRHQPGQKDGTCDPGETDVDVTFPVLLK